MKRFLLFIALVLVAILMAGIFGIIHDQITYTISPEYYTKFKFRQFELLNSPLPDRVRAAMVGFLASWWMGIPIGILVGSVGFIHHGHLRMFAITLRAFVLVVVFTLLAGLVGLAYGYFVTADIDRTTYRGWYIPRDVVELRSFLCVGYMHNASYIGGALSIVVAWIYHFIVRAHNRSK